MKVLYIPADNISANFSRSYHIAKNLSTHCDLYRVMWKDNRSAFWEGKKVSSFNGLSCFLKSFFQKGKIIHSKDFGYEVYASVFISAFIGRLIGKYRALRWMRAYNGKTLKKLVAEIKPDVIFHADGYYFFPALNSTISEFSDLQDDINWSNIPSKNLAEARTYYTNQFNISKLNFIVSESAKHGIKKYIKSDFTPISNGADFDVIRNISEQDKIKFKEKFNIPSQKKIASYIGGSHKFDIKFSEALINHAAKHIPDLVFVLAGNLPTFKSPNVIFTGIISNNEANVLYSISNVGLTLKNTKDNDFIFHSVPLKFIQYAAAKKPIVSFPVKWSIDSKFPNIVHIATEDVDLWITETKKIIDNFSWEESYNLLWQPYDWKNVTIKIHQYITKHK